MIRDMWLIQASRWWDHLWLGGQSIDQGNRGNQISGHPGSAHRTAEVAWCHSIQAHTTQNTLNNTLNCWKNSEAEVKNKDEVHVTQSPQSCSRQTVTDPDQLISWSATSHYLLLLHSSVSSMLLCCRRRWFAHVILQPRCVRPLNSVIPPPPRHPPVGSVSTISCRGLLFSPFSVHQGTSKSRQSLTRNLLNLFPASAIK